MYATQIAQLVGGHVAIAVCALLYGVRLLLGSEAGAEKLPEGRRRVVMPVLAGAVGVLCVAALGLFVAALTKLPHAMPAFVVCAVPLILCIIAEAVAYILLGRPLSATIALAFVWLGCELNFLNGIVSVKLITGASLIVLFALVAVAMVLSAACYCVSPLLHGKRQVAGIVVPCALVACVCIAFALCVHM